MNPNIEDMFDEAENRYLKPEELNHLNHYVDSLPSRLETYRYLRDQEISIMQKVADSLEKQFPDGEIAILERCLKNALLILRYSAMGMLLNDENFLKNRLINWLEGTAKAYQTEVIDQALYNYLNDFLGEALTTHQLELLNPHLLLAQGVLVGQKQAHAIA